MLFRSQPTKSATVMFVDQNGQDVTTNASLKHITEADTKVTEFDFSKYAADLYQTATFKEVKLAHNGKTFGQSTLIDNKIKKVTDSEGTKWQYTTTTKVEGSEDKHVDTGYIADNDTIYVVYTNGVQLTTVETVDNQAKGFHLYMTDYDDNDLKSIIGGEYGNGSTKLGLYSRVTNNEGYPTLTHNPNKSIGQWFPASDKTEVNHLFIKSVYDETGYFYYNSAENFATLINDSGKTTQEFTVYNQLGTPGSNAYYYQRGNFMPYNVLDPSWPISNNLFDDQGGRLSIYHPRYNERLYGLLKWTSNGWSRKNNFRFGMYGWAEFYQPVGGKVNGEDMVFEFTGDDDMVVYIDGVLVLDLGGIHDAQSGYINFANGEVGYTDQTTGDPVHWADRTNIFDQFDAAQSTVRTSWKKGTKTFADGSKHKIQFFYMERGKGASNLKIKVNIPPIPDGSVNIQIGRAHV